MPWPLLPSHPNSSLRTAGAVPFPSHLLPREQSHKGWGPPHGVSPEAQASGGGRTDLGWHCLETALRRRVGLLSALRLSEVGGRLGGMSGTRPHQPVGLREAGCDLIFLMVLSLVLLGCGGSLPSPTPEWGMLGDWKHLNFLFY